LPEKRYRPIVFEKRTAMTGRQLLRDGLGRLSPAGKTGTSNDGRDSWFAGYTGDHLAVVWVGNDQNQSTGLYGATGGMRVWSDIFARLPSAPLRLSGDGVDWRWTLDGMSTDGDCPGARHLPFVAGYAPPYQPCPYTPPAALDEFGNPQFCEFVIERPAANRHRFEQHFGIEDRCPKNDGGHEPDWTSVHVEFDGDAYVDLTCKHCGQSGCIGSEAKLTEQISW